MIKTPQSFLLSLTTTTILLLLTFPTQATLSVEVFMPGERGHLVNSGIVTSSKEMLIIDAQLSTEFGRRLGLRAKSLNKHLKAIYITHGHVDHTWGTQELLKVFPGTPVYASQETIDKMNKESPGWLDPKLFRPFPNNLGAPSKIIIPQLWNESTIELDGESVHLVPQGQGDTEHITAVDIPSSKGTVFRPWNAWSKKDITFTPSNGTFWGSDIIISGIHFLMDEVESLARRQDWIDNAKKVRDHVKSNNQSIVPGHLDSSRKWTEDEMLEFPVKYVETYNEALKENTTNKFWNKVMTTYADTALLFLLDWSSTQFYESKRKAPVP